MKVALLGSFPMYPYRDIVSFINPRKNLVTSWNYNLAKALAKLPSIEVHFFPLILALPGDVFLRGALLWF